MILPHTARIDRPDLYMAIAHLFAQRSTCLRGQVGSVAVKNNHIVAAGYNGAPPGMPHCLDVGCGGGVVTRPAQLDPLPGGEVPRPAEMQDVIEFPDGCTRAVHAEANLVAYAARLGVSLEGSTVYNTAGPCLPCAKLLVTAGIAEFWWHEPYWRMKEGLELIDAANIRVCQYGS